ncbi:RrF2 family transcriptional regulator [Brevibacillus daliensis]|uniref:RrF2 family transcriptional regulator n=1 Tax=Brevibacillus daliensis TaxID=2892995 RepID=UPI001E2843CD|nr:Rrf2 family transcriptional regulator [Brevibacillus daliensis]
MRLSKFSDFSFRILITLAASPDELYTVERLASELELSLNHLKKVVHLLAKEGYIKSTKGRYGGLRLGKRPDEINLGELLKLTEGDFSLAECFMEGGTCTLSPHCKLKGVLSIAMRNFLKEFDNRTLQDIIW